MKVLVHVCVLLALASSAVNATVLFYGGSPTPGAYSCFYQNNLTECRCYDNFRVSGTWAVNEIWGNYQYSNSTPYSPVTSARYEIRQGIASGTGGTLLYSGEINVIQTPLNISWPYSTFSTLHGALPNILLGAGDYWMTLAPVCGWNEYYSITHTYNNDGVGTPLLDGVMYSDSPESWHRNWEQINDLRGGLSYGLAGTIVPEPSTIMALFCGLIGIGGTVIHNRKRM